MKKIQKNNKGFSLVELIIAVVILGIVVIPLLQAFTTSAKITSKSRRMGEITAVAQNIQEVIEASSVASMLANTDLAGTQTTHMQNQDVLSLLGVTSDDTDVLDDGRSLIIRNLVSGNRQYDAKVMFSTAKASVTTINNKEIAQYTDMTGTFSQPYASNQNPDDLANNEYQLVYGNTDKYMLDTDRPRTRTINVYVDSEPTSSDPADGYDVYVDVEFAYMYYYYQKDTSGNWDSRRKQKSIKISYSIFPSGYHIKSYENEVSCYLMYYAFYENITSTESINVYVDNENDDSEIQFKLFLVKQWPMVDTPDGRVAADKNSDIIRKDRQYRFQINEYHNANFEIQTVDSSHASESMMNVYTNANVFLDGNGLWEDYGYRIRSLSSNKFFYFTKDSKIKNQLVKTQQEDRYYDVTIWIYETGADIETHPENKIYELNASKLK